MISQQLQTGSPGSRAPRDFHTFEVEEPSLQSPPHRQITDRVGTVKRKGSLLAHAAVEIVRDAKPPGRLAVAEVSQGDSTQSRSSLLKDSAEVGDDTTRLAQVSILTLNVWVNKATENVHRQIAGIRAYGPDIICLQEVFSLEVLNSYRNAFPDHRLVAFEREYTCLATVSFFAALVVPPTLYAGCVALPLYSLSAINHVGWPCLLLWLICLAGHAALFLNHYFVPFLVGNMTGLALLVRDDGKWLEQLSTRCELFSYPLGQAEDFLNRLRPRGFLLASGYIRLRGWAELLPIRIATTHLNQPPVQPVGSGRHQQVKELCRVLLEHQNHGGLVLLGADLNATPPATQSGTLCSTYTDMCESLTDAWDALNASDPNVDGLTWDQCENPLCLSALNSIFYGTSPLRWRCDYIFWRCDKSPSLPDVNVSFRSCNMVFVGDDAISDHFGVLALIDITAS